MLIEAAVDMFMISRCNSRDRFLLQCDGRLDGVKSISTGDISIRWRKTEAVIFFFIVSDNLPDGHVSMYRSFNRMYIKL